MFKNRKGVLGLETVKMFMVFILLLAVITIALFVALPALLDADSSLVDATRTGTFSNETINLTDAGNTPTSVSGLRSVTLTGVIVTNATGGEIVNAGNYSISAGTLSSASSEYNSTNVNVSASQTNLVKADGQIIVDNVTSGVTGFFGNIPTVFTILGAVIIILAVSLILFAVGKFTKGSVSSVSSGVDTRL